ncbi:MAG: M23 family metallopeptidase [Vicinamibacterales bacterium]
MKRPRMYALGASTIAYILAIGISAGWWLHELLLPQPDTAAASAIDLPIPTAPADRPPPPPEPPPVPTGHVSEYEEKGLATISANPIAELRRHRLQLPIDDADVDNMKGGFEQRRNGNRRAHEAVDILAPRNTPIHAVDDGTIARLFYSRNGGITIYQFDPARRFCYYYAHLEKYAEGLAEGQEIEAGDVVGYVGTTGNAPPSTPHLHFAVFELNPEQRWWEGTPIDPYLVYSDDDDSQ